MSFRLKEPEFRVHYGGKVGLDDDEELDYIGGDVLVLKGQAEELFTMMENYNLSSYGEKLLYKLPYEHFMDGTKVLRKNSKSIRRMCKHALKNRYLEIFPFQMIEDERWVENDMDDAEDSDDYGPNSDGEEDCDEAEYEIVPMIQEERWVENDVDDAEDSDDSDGPNSDGDEAEYVRYKLGSGELKLRQVFDSLDEFKDAVVCYVLKKKHNVEFYLRGRDRSGAICCHTEVCPWRIYCSYEEPVGKYMVKTFEDLRTCKEVKCCKILKPNVIARLFLNNVRLDPMFKPETMKEKIKKWSGFDASLVQCKKAKRQALCEASKYAGLENYRREILVSNPSSSVVFEFKTHQRYGIIDGKFYVCFKALQETWHNCCRPSIEVDYCFINCEEKVAILAAVGRDSNNELYPVAWAVVEGVEKESDRVWFMHHLKMDLKLGDGTRIISNFENSFSVYQSIFDLFYSGRYDDEYSIISWDWVEMLVTIQRRVMKEIALKKNKAMGHKGRFSLRAAEVVYEEQGNVKHLQLKNPGTDGVVYEVEENGGAVYSIDMKHLTCVCSRWKKWEIPCCHVLKVISEKKLDPEDYIPDWYLTSRWQEIYSSSVLSFPILRRRGPLEFIISPPTDENHGRKPKPNMKKRLHESPTEKTKVTRKKRIMHCQRCGNAGHNSKTCQNKVMESPTKKTNVPRKKRIMHCQRCGNAGHNSKTCQNKVMESPTKKTNVPRQKRIMHCRRCGYEDQWT